MKKKGFTLVELLAVIVIIAIILLLAIPKIGDIIYSSRKNAFKNNAYAIVSTAEKLYQQSYAGSLNEESVLYDIENGKILHDGVEVDMVEGKIEGTGFIQIDFEGESKIALENDEFCAVKQFNEAEVTVSDKEEGTQCGKIYISFSWELNGGTPAQDFETSYLENTKITLLEPTKENSEFVNWEVIKGNSIIKDNVLTIGGKDTTIYAVWENWPTLTLDLNGGTIENNFGGAYKSGTTIETTKPTKEGYAFAGWVVSSGNGVVSGNNFTMGSSNTTIKATWKVDKVNINYNLNGGTAGASAPTEGKSGSTVTVSNPSKTGYTFIDWTISGTGASINDTSLTLGTSDVTLSANWSINTYQVDVNPVIDGTSYNSGLSGCTFDVWVNGSLVADDVTDWCQNVSYGSTVRVKTNNVTGRSTSFDSTITVGASNTTIAPSWSTNTYAISYTLNGGTVGSSAPTSGTYGSTVTISNPTRSGYAFAGWIVSGNGAVLSGNSLTIGEGDVTLTAEWIKTITEFAYTGGGQTYTATTSGYYKLEVWGAQGGSYNEKYYGGYGGYSTGEIYLNKDEMIYIYVGGTTSGITGGYNGGGVSNSVGKGGGGATHISKANGELSSLSQYAQNNQSPILIVSGGGGGAYYEIFADVGFGNIGGNSGGYIGGNGLSSRRCMPYGGTQTSGGKCGDYSAVSGNFGKGGTGPSFSAGGGGGYYGGAAGGPDSANGGDYGTGGGGSGYIGNTLLTDKYMYCYNCATSDAVDTKTYTTTCANETPTGNCAKKGNGYAKITFVGKTIN